MMTQNTGLTGLTRQSDEKKRFCINAYGIRALCKRNDFRHQELVKTTAEQHNYLNFNWSEEDNAFISAYVEFSLLHQAIAYAIAINPYTFSQRYVEELEKQVYVRMNGGRLAGLYSDPEKRIKFRLQSIIGGKTEVTTPLGRIDLLTDTQVIEVKP